MIELKECPFCGGKARRMPKYMSDGCAYAVVECAECGASTPGNYSTEGDQAEWDLNARAERTCTMLDDDSQMGCVLWWCSECGRATITICGAPNHCEWCGAKVVE